MEADKLENDIMEFYKILINNKKEYLQLFSKLQIQIEGWFRGELMNYFNEHVHELTNKNREVPPCDMGNNNGQKPDMESNERQKVDLRLELDGKHYWIELKHILIGYQITTPISLGFYFSDKAYIDNDIKKLAQVCDPDTTHYLYSLTFISTNYAKERGKESRINKIETLEDLKKKFDEVKKNHPNLENDISVVSWDYDKDLHFGYMLLKVKNNKAP